MRSIQEIFDVVLDTGAYDPSGEEYEHCSRYMCFALEVTHELFNVITEEECKVATEAATNYVALLGNGGTRVLSTALAYRDLPHSPDDLINIYKDWNNRPRPQE